MIFKNPLYNKELVESILDHKVLFVYCHYSSEILPEFQMGGYTITFRSIIESVSSFQKKETWTVGELLECYWNNNTKLKSSIFWEVFFTQGDAQDCEVFIDHTNECENKHHNLSCLWWSNLMGVLDFFCDDLQERIPQDHFV
jgi:hypothetical protein